jgi:hypothetical protein
MADTRRRAVIWVLAKGRGPDMVFWTGKFFLGEPDTTDHWSEAAKFHDAVAVNEAATTHRALRNSDEWRPWQPREGGERLS